MIGRVDDLTPWFDRARVFVAPTGYAAGIPLKILHAAALGVPVVCTGLLQRQLGWTDGVELRVADDAAGFAAACCDVYRDETEWSALRDAALLRIAGEFSQVRFDEAVADALRSVTATGDTR